MNRFPDTCPKCQRPLSPRKIEGFAAGRCSGCKGLWLRREDLSELLEPVAPEAAMRVRQLGQDFCAPTQLACPACSALLSQTWLAELEVEYCPSCHGVFLDASELEQATYRDHSLENWGRTERKKRDGVIEKWGTRLGDVDLSIVGILERLVVRLVAPSAKRKGPEDKQ